MPFIVKHTKFKLAERSLFITSIPEHIDSFSALQLGFKHEAERFPTKKAVNRTLTERGWHPQTVLSKFEIIKEND